MPRRSHGAEDAARRPAGQFSDDWGHRPTRRGAHAARLRHCRGRDGEGRKGGGRVYLNAGKVRTVDLAIVILRPNIQSIEARGVELLKLTGRRIRARGLLDRRFGPQIEIATPDVLEIVGQAAESGARGR